MSERTVRYIKLSYLAQRERWAKEPWGSFAPHSMRPIYETDTMGTIQTIGVATTDHSGYTGNGGGHIGQMCYILGFGI